MRGGASSLLRERDGHAEHATLPRHFEDELAVLARDGSSAVELSQQAMKPRVGFVVVYEHRGGDAHARHRGRPGYSPRAEVVNGLAVRSRLPG